MAINFTYTFSPTTTIASSEVNTNNEDWRTAVRGAHHRDADGTAITNADISASAAIAYSKLSLSNSIVNNDISSSAAIGYLKLDLYQGIVNNDISPSAAIAVSKISGLGSLATLSSVSDAYITSVAASKITTGTMTGDFAATGTIISTGGSVSAKGTAGAGYFEAEEQSVNPSTGGSGKDRMYFDGSGNLKFRRDDGKIATLNLVSGSINAYA